MNLDNLTFPAGVGVEYIQKKYFGRYIYKMVMYFDELNDRKIKRRSINYNLGSSRRSHLEVKKLIRSIVHDKKTNFRLRIEGNIVSFFTNDTDHIRRLATDVPDKILKFEKPFNDAHKEILENKSQIIVRKSLFAKKFKYKIHLKSSKSHRESRYAEVKSYVKSISNLEYGANSTLEDYWNPKKLARYLGWSISLYLNHMEDIMMFRLKFDDLIWKIEEVVLIDELKTRN
jgi:hypothetical protein